MLRIGYLFERFPSFVQTFCYREVAELIRHGAEASIFAIRRPKDEPPQDWDEAVVQRVIYVPEEAELVKQVERAVRHGELPDETIRMLREWGRQSDFLRLYQAAWIGVRLKEAGLARVHAHFAGMAARTAYWINRFFGFTFSVTAHANDIFAPRPYTVSLEKIFDAAVAVVTVSDFSRRQLVNRFPCAAAKFCRVYNGINVDRFRIATFTSDPPLIVSVGRLIEKKGFADLIAACALLKERRLDFRCAIIGEGPLRSDLAGKIRAGGLDREVQLLGPLSQNQIIDRLAAANVFALACTTEADGGMDNLPTVIMEAMAAGLPVVSTALAGVPEMVQPGVTGELVPDRDPRALADAIESLVRQPLSAQELGRAARDIAQAKFSIQTNVRALAEILA